MRPMIRLPGLLVVRGRSGDDTSQNTDNMAPRFDQAAAIVGGSEAGLLHTRSGVTVYSVKAGRIDEGVFMPLDEKP